MARHANDEKHSFDFENAKIIFPCNNESKRHVVEASLTHLGDTTCNLNRGFIHIDKSIGNFVT